MSRFVVWTAGFFDGEGSITIARNRRPKGRIEHCLLVAITQKVRKPLDEIAERWGGYVIPIYNKKTERGYFAWHVSAKIANRFLKDIVAFLRVKRRDAEVGIEFQKTKRDTRKHPSRFRTSEAVLALREAFRKELFSIHNRGGKVWT